jgi:hypothetical protein
MMEPLLRCRLWSETGEGISTAITAFQAGPEEVAVQAAIAHDFVAHSDDPQQQLPAPGEGGAHEYQQAGEYQQAQEYQQEHKYQQAQEYQQEHKYQQAQEAAAHSRRLQGALRARASPIPGPPAMMMGEHGEPAKGVRAIRASTAQHNLHVMDCAHALCVAGLRLALL